MYNRSNPVALVMGKRAPMGRRRRQWVGAEFGTCPDGTQVKGNPTPAKCGTSMLIPEGGGGGSWAPGGGGGGGGGNTPTYIPDGGGGGGSGGGTPYTPPSGGGGGTGGYTPPVITTIPQIPNTPGCAPLCNVCPENQKRYYMPFVPSAGYTATVTAGSLVVFVGRPQKLFAPDRLIIGSTIGAYFDIVSLTIGNIPQSLAAGNVGAEMFSEVATYVMMTFDQAYPGIDIILTAQNKSSVTQTFQAQLVGEAVG